jgi:hypothetical protein
MPLWIPQKTLPTRLLWELAIVGTLAFHALLLFLLRAQPVAAARTTAPLQPQCVFLPPESAVGGWEKELYTWLRLEDPALLSLPNSRRGFSGYLREKAVLPVAPAPAHAQQPATAERTEFPPLAWDQPAEALADSLVRHWRSAQPAVVATSMGTAVPRSVLWRFADGTPVPRMPEPIAADISEAWRQGTPQNPTRIDVSLPRSGTGTARLRLVDSCGNAALDRVALQQVAFRAADWERNNQFRKTVGDSDRFVPENDFTETIEVEWRLATAEAEKK